MNLESRTPVDGPAKLALHSGMVRRDRTPTRCRMPALAVGLSLLLTVGLGACQPGPITENDQRSQFDRYDMVRDRYAPAYTEDVYGRKRPNLRGRLVGRD